MSILSLFCAWAPLPRYASALPLCSQASSVLTSIAHPAKLQPWGRGGTVYTFLQCCLDPIETFGAGANDAYLEYFLKPEEAAPLGLEPGLTVLREADLHLLQETPRQLWRRLITQHKVPVKYQFGLLVQILIRQRFHDLDTRQTCLSIRILALSALGKPFANRGWLPFLTARMHVAAMEQAVAGVLNQHIVHTFHGPLTTGIQEMVELLSHPDVTLSLKTVGFRLLQSLIQTQVS